ncbi:unnamed protein product [Heterobilharzia americana]|nr:unnamed protein product [Heterobilharzia americana]
MAANQKTPVDFGTIAESLDESHVLQQYSSEEQTINYCGHYGTNISDFSISKRSDHTQHFKHNPMHTNT